MKKLITIPLVLLCLLLIGGRGPIEITGSGGGSGGSSGATFIAINDANCQGAWLLFTDGTETGAENDACSGGVLDMTYSGSAFALAANTPEGTPAIQDAVNFDGADDLFDLADNAALEAATFTMGCWVQHEAGNGTESFFSHDGGGEWNMKDASGLSGFNGDVAIGYSEGNAIDTPDDDWFFAVLRFNDTPNTSEVFFNGTLDCDGGCDSAGSPAPGTTEPIRIGGRSDGSQDWTGDIMECIYLDRGLTDIEIETWFLCGADGLADGSARGSPNLTNAPTCVGGTHGCCG